MEITVIEFPELSCCELGCHGNLNVSTPEFDRLTASSFVADACYVDPDGPGLRDLVSAEVDLRTLAPIGKTPPERYVERTNQLEQQLREAIDNCADNSLVIVTAKIGYDPWNGGSQPEWVRSVSDPLTHVPLVIAGKGIPVRHSGLIATEDVAALVRMVQSGLVNPLETWRASLARTEIRQSTPLARALRTRQWLLVERRSDEQDSGEEPEIALFRKPEDLWDLFDVAAQNPAVVDELREFAVRD